MATSEEGKSGNEIENVEEMVPLRLLQEMEEKVAHKQRSIEKVRNENKKLKIKLADSRLTIEKLKGKVDRIESAEKRRELERELERQKDKNRSRRESSNERTRSRSRERGKKRRNRKSSAPLGSYPAFDACERNWDFSRSNAQIRNNHNCHCPRHHNVPFCSLSPYRRQKLRETNY